MFLERTQRTFISVMTAWWWDNSTHQAVASMLPWASTSSRTLIQQAFAWELATWMRDAGHMDSLRDMQTAFQSARGSCRPQTVAIPAFGDLPTLRIAYLPHDGTVAPLKKEHRWCLRVSCANTSWVTHCFGTMDEKMACAIAQANESLGVGALYGTRRSRSRPSARTGSGWNPAQVSSH